MTQPPESPHMNAEIWNTFTSDPATGVTLLTVDGEIVFINEQATRIFFNEPRDPQSLSGKSIRDIGFPDAWVEERMAILQKIANDGQGLLLRTIWHGKQKFSWMRLIKAENESEGDRVLVITRRIPATEESNALLQGEHEVVHSDFVRLGELEVVTPRELEVLALLGQQMSIKEIAAALYRSVKTIENHRESIGRKLKRTRGIELAGIAQVAGLVIGDSKRKRVEDIDRSENPED